MTMNTVAEYEGPRSRKSIMYVNFENAFKDTNKISQVIYCTENCNLRNK